MLYKNLQIANRIAEKRSKKYHGMMQLFVPCYRKNRKPLSDEKIKGYVYDPAHPEDNPPCKIMVSNSMSDANIIWPGILRREEYNNAA